MPRPFRIPIESFAANCLFCMPVIAISCFLIALVVPNPQQISVVLGILGGGLCLWCVREGMAAPVSACCNAHAQLHLSVRLEWMHFCKPHKHKSYAFTIHQMPSSIIHPIHQTQTPNP